MGDSAFQIPHSPVAALGTLTLLVAFVVIAYAAAAGIVGQRKQWPRVVQSSLYASWAFAALMTLASALIVYAFVAQDLRIKYVAHYSASTTPLFYKLTAYWGGLDGSLMFWVWMLSGFAAVALFVNRHRHRDMIGYVVATIAIVSLFFLSLLLYSKNPFSTFLTAAPTEGKDLNPLLQTYWMAIHPPSLYTGYVGMTIPFAFAMGALASGRLDDSWLHSIRVWVIIPWFFLSLGLVLGGIWAYEELGWGGYWAWDPVENAGLFPWFTATAFLHSVMMQERRGMMKTWNVTLIIITFFLTIFGTFMTRSGIVQSVHAFGQDNELALLFLLFMAVMLVISVGLLLYRLPSLRSSASLESFISREFAFLLNNWILLAAAFFVLFATMFPTLSEYLIKQRITVGPPFFNRFMVPVGLVLLFLAAIAPLLAWRKTTQQKLLEQVGPPFAFAFVVVGTLALFVPQTRAMSPLFGLEWVDKQGVTRWVPFPLVLTCFGLVALTFASIVQEFVRGTIVRVRQTGSDPFSALIGIVVSKRRKYGGYIVHGGVALMFVGFAGKFYSIEEPYNVTEGSSFEVGGYAFHYDQFKVVDLDQKTTYTATVRVTRGKEKIATLYPARWAYKFGEQQVTSEVAIDRGLAKDIYIVLNGSEPRRKLANFTVYINPLVNFVWMGFGMLALGTAICLLPESLIGGTRPRTRGPMGKIGEAVVVILVVGGSLFGLARMGMAQSTPPPSHTAPPAKHVEIPNAQETRKVHPTIHKLWEELVCLCGGCGRETLAECRCGVAATERDRILAMAEGKDLATVASQKQFYDEVVKDQMARWGGAHVLRTPPDTPFNRLAWMIPYAAMAGAVVLIALVGRSWVKRGRKAGAASTGAPAAGSPSSGDAPKDAPRDAVKDQDLQDKLDDELRDLD